MNRLIKNTFVAAALSACALTANAGNPDRAGQAGATELLVNGWARSSGWGGNNTASVRGIEATSLNIAGLAYTKTSEINLARTSWLVPSGIFINNLGFAQRLSDNGVLGLTVSSINFGEIPITTTSQPDGGLGTYRPQFINVGLAYAHRFSSSISGGILLRGVSEEVVNVKSQGFALDAGVQYATSSKKITTGNPKFQRGKDDIKFGISLRNIGPDMVFRGDGLSAKANLTEAAYTSSSTIEIRAAKFNLPSLLNIGGSYDFRLDRDSISYFHRLTLAANFNSNTFSKNQFGVGLEYAYKEFLMIRGGFTYEDGLFNKDERTTALTGFSAGATVEVPFSGRANALGIDYSYRSSSPFQGIHSIGIRLTLGNDKD